MTVTFESLVVDCLVSFRLFVKLCAFSSDSLATELGRVSPAVVGSGWLVFRLKESLVAI